MAEDLPVEGGQSQKSCREGGKLDSIDVIEDFYAVCGLEDVAAVVAEEGAGDFGGLIAHFGSDFDVLVDVFLEDGLSIDEIGFVVLLKNFDGFGAIESFEGDCLCLNVGGDVREVEVAPALIEGDGADILDDGELIVVDSNCKGDLFLDGGSSG